MNERKRLGPRTKARKRAMEILFEADQRGITVLEMLRLRSTDEEYPVRPYAAEIVNGVASQQEEIDELLQTYSQGWSLERMPAVDRELLRIGVWEIVFNDAIPDKVAIDEAVTLAKEFSTDDSSGFVSGLLGRILDMKPTLGY